jgi:signal transduction histidine kinase
MVSPKSKPSMLVAASMRARASVVLSAVAVAQILVLGASLGLLIPRFRDAREDLIRLGREEQLFLNQLSDAESDIYRTSILLRDNIILNGPEQQRARQELLSILTKIGDRPLRAPSWISPAMAAQLEGAEAIRREYLERPKTVLAWSERDRRTLGPRYLYQELVPPREKFVAEERKLAALARAIRESHDQDMANSIQAVERLTTQIVAGAALLGLALAGLAVWRFRQYEKERDTHLLHLQQVENDLRALSQRLVTSQELERKKLSRDLHDEVGQILTALRVQLGQIESSTGSASNLAQASELADRSLRTVRELARVLRPAMLDDLGLAPALGWLGRDFSKNTALDVDVHAEGEFSGLDEPTRTYIFRVVQEALTNCVKHSGAARARVVLRESTEEITVTVQDDGHGFSPGEARGIGLLGMRERVEELDGDFAIVSTPGTGTLIRVKFPKARKRQHDSNPHS